MTSGDLSEPGLGVTGGRALVGKRAHQIHHGIEIVDRGGSREQFALPHHLGDTNRYTKVFVGALYDRKPGAEEISDPEHTKRMLIKILRKTPNRDAWADFCLMSLRHRPIDFVTCLFHKWKGRYD